MSARLPLRLKVHVQLVPVQAEAFGLDVHTLKKAPLQREERIMSKNMLMMKKEAQTGTNQDQLKEISVWTRGGGCYNTPKKRQSN